MRAIMQRYDKDEASHAPLPLLARREGSGAMADAATISFGDLLRRHRLAAGLTQPELAERAGLSVRGINDLERGERQHPRKDTVALLADALGLAGDDRTAFAAAGRGMRRHPPAADADQPHPPALSAPALPTGTVTFLFTDIAGSTHLLQDLGRERYAALQAEHYRLLRAACMAHQGHEVDTAGDGVFVAFPTATDALAAAAAAQRALAAHTWPAGTVVRVRMGLHTGTAQVTADGYVGLDVHRAARIAAAGHGGQVLLSQATHDLVEDALPDGAVLRDLGAHRLKDLQRPEHLFQLVLPDLPADFPPLEALDHHAHNLPIQPTPLLGREDEVASVCALLRREDVRLVTLTGPGGVGKTRLGLQVAAELMEQYPDGVWFVRLSRIADPALVLPTIAQTLGLREAGSVPIAALLREYLRSRQLLLVLDNFEQVAPAAGSVADLLAYSLHLQALVTSRVALHLQGEHEYPVPPLALPSAPSSSGRSGNGPSWDEVTASPAVALFVAQARMHRPAFALTEASAPAVAAICARLDGLPLALGLAAARIKLLPPAQLLARLEHRLPLLIGGARDLEERQQTLQSTLAWSEDLLQPAERRLFWRLAVFVGGFTLVAAEAVCAAPEGAERVGLAVLDGLAALVDHSLVQHWSEGQGGAEDRQEGSEARFRLLYVVREYALERLEASGERAALRRAHAVYYLGLVEERALAVYGPEGPAWMEWLEREHDNFRAALAWASEQGDTVLGLRLAASLGPFWYVRGYHTEGREWVDGLLAQASRAADRAGKGDDGSAEVPGMAYPMVVARAKALIAASNFAWVQEDDDRALAAAEEALALARIQPAGWAAGVALCMMGVAARDRGDLERAAVYLEESVAQLRAAGEPWLAASYLAILGGIARDQGDLERATACCEESLAFARRTGAGHPEGFALACLADVARQRGDLAAAEALGHEQLQIWRRLGAPAHAAGVLEDLAFIAAAAGEGARTERVAHLLASAAALRETVGASLRPWRRAEMERVAASARLALGEERWAAAFAAGSVLSLEEAVAEALDETAGR